MPSDADAARATRRVQALSAHVEGGAVAGASKGAPDPRVRLAPGGGPGSLTVVDNRTGSRYEVPVREGGYVSASAFKAIKAGGDGGGLRVFDPGYMNTAPCKSKICFIDGDKGVLRYRGYEIEELAEKSSYLETAFALIYGDLPDAPQLREWEQTIMRHSALPVPVIAAL